MTPNQHRRRAERLIEAGNRLLSVIDDQEMHGGGDVSAARDALYQKLMGIYARAQVHATLANFPDAATDGGE